MGFTPELWWCWWLVHRWLGGALCPCYQRTRRTFPTLHDVCLWPNLLRRVSWVSDPQDLSRTGCVSQYTHTHSFDFSRFVFSRSTQIPWISLSLLNRAAQLHGTPCNCHDTRSPQSHAQPPCISSVSPQVTNWLVFCSSQHEVLHTSALTADQPHSFFEHIHHNSPEIDGSSSQWRCTASFVTVVLQDTPLQLRIAAIVHTHCHFVCVCFSSIFITRRPQRVPSTMSLSPSSSARASLVSPVKTRHVSRSHPRTGTRTGKSDVYQQSIAGLSQGQRRPPRSGWQCGCFCLTPHHKTTRPPPAKFCSLVLSSTWPRFWFFVSLSTNTRTRPRFCFFLDLDELGSRRVRG